WQTASAARPTAPATESRTQGSPVRGNRVYGNATVGITATGASPVEGNRVYTNPVGIQLPYGFSGVAANNLVYPNSNQGILVQESGGFGAEVVNNTVYQPVGDAVRLDSGAKNIKLRNNLLWVLSGYDLNVASNSQTGFTSDYNLFHKSADPN